MSRTAKSWRHTTTILPMYKYCNVQPNKKKLPDCVCRAISLACDAEYYDIMALLQSNAIENSCESLNVGCYSKILDEIGYPCFPSFGRTVEEIGAEHPDKRLIVRMDGHLTCVLYGVCHDIWDCTGRAADKFWMVM